MGRNWMSQDANSDNPYLPSYLPEFHVFVGWAMCRNFGIQYAGPAPAGAAEINDGRDTIDTIEGKFRCEYCGDTFALNSNSAIRVLARHFLSQSLPFAACDTPKCDNFGCNFFEHYVPSKRHGNPYSIKDAKKHRLLRKRCRQPDDKERPLTVGVALNIIRTRETKKRLERIIHGAMDARSV